MSSLDSFPAVVPLTLKLSNSYTQWLSLGAEDTRTFLGDLFYSVREKVFHDLGVVLPHCELHLFNPDIPEDSFMLLLDEVPVFQKSYPRNKALFSGDLKRAPDEISFDVEEEWLERGRDALWAEESDMAALEDHGFQYWNPAQFLALLLTRVLSQKAYRFVGVQEVAETLDKLRPTLPNLIEEVTPKQLSLPHLTEILRRLVEEQISIRNQKRILEALAEWTQIEKDPLQLSEFVRMELRDYITYRTTGGRGSIVVYLLDPQIEQTIEAAIGKTEKGTHFSLKPELAQGILDAVITAEIDEEVDAEGLGVFQQQMVILTNARIRRYVRQLLSLEYPDVAVLSYQELNPDLPVYPVSKISIRANQSSL